MVHLKYNPILKEIPDIQTRFWEQFIVDMLINNNDRNNGNWGVLYENGEYRLAPVFDNGASFSNKTPDCKIIECLMMISSCNKVSLVRYLFIETMDIKYTEKTSFKLKTKHFMRWLQK